MKLGWKTLTVVSLVALALSACGKKGGGGSNASTPGAGACTLDAYGQCVGGTGESGYVQRGSWEGSLSVTNPDLYRQMAFQVGLCTSGYSYYGQLMCSQLSNWFGMRVRLLSDWLPGAGSFTINPASMGRIVRGRSFNGDAYMNRGGYGFNLVANAQGMGFGHGFGHGQGWQQPGVAQNNAIQVVVTNVNLSAGGAYNQGATVAVLFRGSQFASGQLRMMQQSSPRHQNDGWYQEGDDYYNKPQK
jgi:hypothetical protein